MFNLPRYFHWNRYNSFIYSKVKCTYYIEKVPSGWWEDNKIIFVIPARCHFICEIPVISGALADRNNQVTSYDIIWTDDEKDEVTSYNLKWHTAAYLRLKINIIGQYVSNQQDGL